VTELTKYYRDRATEYDAVYAKPERQDDLAELRALLPRFVTGRHVLEIAAGTGYWTEVLATSAATITATDLSPEPLAIARARECGPADVTFRTADAYALRRVPGDFDTAFLGFFWSHVPRADVPRLLQGLRARLGSGATVIMLDNRYVPGSSTPISRTTPEGDTYQLRTLNNGRTYEVLKNFPAREQFTADIAPISAGLRWTQFRYFWLAVVKLR
jgi:SAM-dependent methyltransferase